MKIGCFAGLITCAVAFGAEGGDFGTNKQGVIGLLPEEGGFNARLTVDGKPESYWHDIPWKGDEEGDVNIVIEIPKGQCAKLEMMTKLEGNPIQQDLKNGMPRFYAKGAMPHNYGMIPQTWESEYEPDPLTNKGGDKDPIDVIDLSTQIFPIGVPVKAKVLGIVGMVDDGETDWKVITIAAGESNYEQWNDIDDIDTATLDSILVWLRTYKSTACLKVNKDNINEFVEAGTLDCGTAMYSEMDECVVGQSEVEFESFGGNPNVSTKNSHYMGKVGALKVIEHTHDFWLKLSSGGYDDQADVGEYKVDKIFLSG